MARSYVRKTARRPYSTEQLEEVLRLIQTGVLSVKRAAARYNIPRSTLQDHLKGRRGKVTGSSRGGAGRGTALSADVENLLAKSISTLAKNGFGLWLMMNGILSRTSVSRSLNPPIATGASCASIRILQATIFLSLKFVLF
jgi:hypothetical protein